MDLEQIGMSLAILFGILICILLPIILLLKSIDKDKTKKKEIKLDNPLKKLIYRIGTFNHFSSSGYFGLLGKLRNWEDSTKQEEQREKELNETVVLKTQDQIASYNFGWFLFILLFLLIGFIAYIIILAEYF
ncbi:MAG: hypothetical protein KJ623_04035 [Nanoarchaeota archaeon]|nr:hypothetical protein [Nanoarchaeota archaeon]MBU0962980.1 hypothetical protein [Nanoarchaeota archaeon]